MSRIVNVTLAGPGSFALTRVLESGLVTAGYSVNAGDTSLDVAIPARGCNQIEVGDIHVPFAGMPVTAQGAAMTPLEVKVDAKDAIAALDAVEIALAVVNAPHSSSDAIDKANEILLAAMTPLLKLDMTCEADAVENPLVKRLRRLASMVRQDGHLLRLDTCTLACALGHADLYKGKGLDPSVEHMAQQMVAWCGSGRNTPDLFELAGQILGATGGAYRG